MAFSGSYARPRSAMYDTNASSFYYNAPTRSSTAYNGSEGLIDDGSVASTSIDFARDGYDDIQLPAPAKAATRPALGSRLLSTLSTNAQPAAAALTRKGSVLHSRAKTLAGLVPKLNTSSTVTTPEETPQAHQQQSHRIFGDLFNGESAPVRLGLPPSSSIKEESEFIMEYKPTFTERPRTERPRGPQRWYTAQTDVSQQHTSTTSTAATNTSARSSWFNRRSIIAPASIPASPPRSQDEILAIDINTALFPNGPADPFSPHAFNDLLLTATDLLYRMQTAYKEKVDYITSIKPEIEAQKEEVEEAETRSRHLKMQLEDMSHKAAEQNEAMREMALQLAEEKLKTSEAQEAASRTVKLVRRSTDNSDYGDDEEDTPRRKRNSAGSQASDSGFESDLEYADSVVSTPLSPPTMTLTPAYDGVEWSLLKPSKRSGGDRPTLGGDRPGLSRSSTAASSTMFHSNHRLGSGGSAWATVESLRGENRDLKRQMEDMQGLLQGCIDFVSTVKA